MAPIYAVGDIHGQKDMLDHALSLIFADGGEDAQIIFLGDYTDRGPNSRAVLDTLITGRDAGRRWTCLTGNHDRMFSNFIRHGVLHSDRIKSGLNWLNDRLGGAQTLASYGVVGQMHFAPTKPRQLEQLTHFEGDSGWVDETALRALAQAAIPAAHLDFLDGLPLTHQTNDLIFVHAGLRPGIPLDQQNADDLIWIRDGFLDNDYDFGKLIVHGHTALAYPQHFGNRVDLDGGAGYGDPLVPAVFEGRDCWTLTPKGRLALTP